MSVTIACGWLPAPSNTPSCLHPEVRRESRRDACVELYRGHAISTQEYLTSDAAAIGDQSQAQLMAYEPIFAMHSDALQQDLI
jgi:hypothetical protein